MLKKTLLRPGGARSAIPAKDLSVAHPSGLFPDGFHHLLAPVADVDTPQAGVGEEPVAVGVLQVAPGRAHLHVVRRDLGGGQLAERVEDVRAVSSDRRAVGDVDGHRNPRGTEQCQVREK